MGTESADRTERVVPLVPLCWFPCTMECGCPMKSDNRSSATKAKQPQPHVLVWLSWLVRSTSAGLFQVVWFHRFGSSSVGSEPRCARRLSSGALAAHIPPICQMLNNIEVGMTRLQCVVVQDCATTTSLEKSLFCSTCL